MPAKTSQAATTTWYRTPPTQRLPHAPRTPPSNPTPSPRVPYASRASGNTLGSPRLPQAPKSLTVNPLTSPRHTKAPPPNPPPSPRLPHGSRLASPSARHPPQATGLSHIPGVAQTTTFPSGLSSQSKLPTSTTSCSPKQPVVSQGSSKIVSPTRLRNADRLPAPPPTTKTQTTPIQEQGWKATRLKEGKQEKEKANEIKDRAMDGRREKREATVGRKVGGRLDTGERIRENEGINNKKSSAEPKVEANKTIIPKRKKSERSNSDTEIKAKKIANPGTNIDDPQYYPQATTMTTSTSSRLPKTRTPEKVSKPGKELRRPTTLKITSHARPTPPRRDQQNLLQHARSVEERLRVMDLGGPAVDMVDSGRKVAEESQDDEKDVMSDDMKTPDAKDYPLRYDDMGDDSTNTGTTPTTEASTLAIYHDDFDGDNDITLDDNEPLSSDTGTFSLDFNPDYELRETHHYSLDTFAHEFKSTEGTEFLSDKTSGDWDDARRGIECTYAVDRVSGGQKPDDGVDVVDRASADQAGQHGVKVRYPFGKRSGHRGIQDGGCVYIDGKTSDHQDELHIEGIIDRTSVDNVELCIEEEIPFPSDQTSIELHIEEVEYPPDGKTSDDCAMREENDLTPSNDFLMIVEPCKEEEGRKIMDSAQEDIPVPSLRIEEGEGDRMAAGTIHGNLPAIDGTLSFPSGRTTPQMDEEKVTRNRETRNLLPAAAKPPVSTPTAPTTMKEVRRKVRPGEVKRDVVAAAPKARVSESRLQDASSTTARAADARRAKKKSREEEDSLKVNKRRSKRKMESEKMREGTKKSARLFVDKGSTASGGGGSRGSRDSRVVSLTRQNGSTAEKKRADGLSAPPRRPRLDNIKSTIPKPGRLPPRNNTDPVKAARPGGNSGSRGPLVGHNGPAHQTQPQPHPAPHADQLRRLEAEVAARVAEARAARNEKEEVGRGLEALTVLLHHLTTTYDPFSTPRLKAEVVRLDTQLTEARLNLDESSAAVRRAEDAANSREQQHQQDTQQLQQQHQQVLDLLRQQHKQDIDLALEKHRKELSKFAEDQQTQREEVSRAHSAELEQLEGEWRNKLDVQHEKHLCALQDLNTQHTHKLRELETSRRARERELEEANYRLTQDQEALRQESRKLQETLLNDTDHRLVAVRKMCTSLKSEVDSLKTVVDMKNSEIHELRGRVVETERLGGELEAARERVRALQAKTEDLQAQMEKRVQQERHLVNEHRHLLETFQRESNTNKRLSLENEELAWKLRQREEIMSTSMPSSTLDLVSRAGPPRHQEGAALPQAAPRSPRVAVRSPSGKVSPSKCDPSKRRSHCLGLSPEDNGIERGGREKQQLQQELSFESPPPSPCVKSVVEKSNSVSFILDLNDSTSDDSFLDLPPSPRPRPQRTASLSAADRPRTPTHIRRVMHNNRANSLNRNGIHVEAKPKDFSRKSREVNGKAKEPHEKSNGKSLEINGRPGSRRTTSESSEGGSEVERISPTGLAWTVPVHQPKSPVKIAPLSNGSPVRKRIEHHLLEDPDEDEYEETPSGTHQFIEVVGLTSSSEAASDSELSQCDIKEGSSADSDSDSSDSERQLQKGIGHKSSPWCPQEGAGEAMITDELLKQYAGDQNSVDAPIPTKGNKRNGRRRLPSAPSSDSDENVTPHNEGNNDVSWSEDVDITSSSEIHEL